MHYISWSWLPYKTPLALKGEKSDKCSQRLVKTGWPQLSTHCHCCGAFFAVKAIIGFFTYKHYDKKLDALTDKVDRLLEEKTTE